MSERHYTRLPHGGGGVEYTLVECGNCHRKMVAVLHLFGVPHHHTPIVTCLDCVVLTEEQRVNFPEVVAKLEEWKQKEVKVGSPPADQ